MILMMLLPGHVIKSKILHKEWKEKKKPSSDLSLLLSLPFKAIELVFGMRPNDNNHLERVNELDDLQEINFKNFFSLPDIYTRNMYTYM